MNYINRILIWIKNKIQILINKFDYKKRQEIQHVVLQKFYDYMVKPLNTNENVDGYNSALIMQTYFEVDAPVCDEFSRIYYQVASYQFTIDAIVNLTIGRSSVTLVTTEKITDRRRLASDKEVEYKIIPSLTLETYTGTRGTGLKIGQVSNETHAMAEVYCMYCLMLEKYIDEQEKEAYAKTV